MNKRKLYTLLNLIQGMDFTSGLKGAGNRSLQESAIDIIKDFIRKYDNKIPIEGEITMEFKNGKWNCNNCGGKQLGYATKCHQCGLKNITLS